MSQRNLYFVPEQDFPIGKFKSLAEEILTQLRIIDGFYSEEDGMLASGENASSLFKGDSSSFEYAEVRDSENLRLIPEGVGPDVAVSCGNCGASVGENFYEAVVDFYEKEGDKKRVDDMSLIKIICGSCQKQQYITDLNLPVERLLHKQYIQFVEIESDIDLSKLEEIEHRLGCKLKVLYE
jgi:hypothetical protein